MAANNENAATLGSYAQAILELADARSATAQVAEEVQALGQIIAQDKTFATYASDPSVGFGEREQTIDRVFGGRVSPVVLSFIKLLNAKNRLGDLPGIAQALKKLLDHRSGNVEVEVTVPKELSHDELASVRQQIGAKLGKNVILRQHVDESIIGGLVLKIGDSLIDGSVKAQLETLKKRLVAAV